MAGSARRSGLTTRASCLLAAGVTAMICGVLLGEPDLFFSTPAYERVPLVMVRLGKVDLARLTELITDAWRMRTDDAG